MGFLVKVVDCYNRILYVTPDELAGARRVDSKDKAEIFKDKSEAIKVATIMKHTEGLKDYIYHIMKI